MGAGGSTSAGFFWGWKESDNLKLSVSKCGSERTWLSIPKGQFIFSSSVCDKGGEEPHVRTREIKVVESNKEYQL